MILLFAILNFRLLLDEGRSGLSLLKVRSFKLLSINILNCLIEYRKDLSPILDQSPSTFCAHIDSSVWVIRAPFFNSCFDFRRAEFKLNLNQVSIYQACITFKSKYELNTSMIPTKITASNVVRFLLTNSPINVLSLVIITSGIIGIGIMILSITWL